MTALDVLTSDETSHHIKTSAVAKQKQRKGSYRYTNGCIWVSPI